MKKLLCLFSVALLVFSSCSSNDDESSKETPLILVNKRVHTYNGKSSTENITYDGNKITSIKYEDGSDLKYTYTRDLITEIKKIDKLDSLLYTIEFDYTNGKLASKLQKNSDSEFFYKTKYTHNPDETVSYELFDINAKNNIESKTDTSGKYTFKNGNLTQHEYFYGESKSIIKYEYDTKNNPDKNILGYNLLLRGAAVNNLIKETNTDVSNDIIDITTVDYTHKYDENNYPTESELTILYGESKKTQIAQYFY